MWQQKKIQLKSRSRGFHLITNEITSQLPELSDYQIGIMHLFIQHSSASISINENADPTVRSDMEAWSNKFIPENESYYRHTYEGADDMPAHIKASLFGNNLTIPVNHGQLQLGTWQGIFLGEHRDHGGTRTLVATLNGE